MGSFLSWGQDGRWEHAFSTPGSKEESGDGGGDREQISNPGSESSSEKKLAKKKKNSPHLPVVPPTPTYTRNRRSLQFPPKAGGLLRASPAWVWARRAVSHREKWGED